jgi:hypothetical protein
MISRHGSHWKARPRSFIGSQLGHKGVTLFNPVSAPSCLSRQSLWPAYRRHTLHDLGQLPCTGQIRGAPRGRVGHPLATRHEERSHDDHSQYQHRKRQRQLEGLVKQKDRPYCAGPCPHWLKVKNRASLAMKRAASLASVLE